MPNGVQPVLELQLGQEGIPMKRMLLLIVLSLILCLLPKLFFPSESKEQLTVELVRQLAEKGEGLTWDDLAPP